MPVAYSVISFQPEGSLARPAPVPHQATRDPAGSHPPSPPVLALSRRLATSATCTRPRDTRSSPRPLARRTTCPRVPRAGPSAHSHGVYRVARGAERQGTRHRHRRRYGHSVKRTRGSASRRAGIQTRPQALVVWRPATVSLAVVSPPLPVRLPPTLPYSRRFPGARAEPTPRRDP